MADLIVRDASGAEASSGGSPGRHAAGASRGSRRRADIEGLRAVAVLGVLAFHAGLPFVPGGFVGVDVFFVISGFLITGLVAAELRTTGRVSFARFYARRVKRLLPAAVLVLVVTALASAVVLAPLARRQAGVDIVSAALYVSNWHFAAQQTDYLAASASPSPVLHYWSLSVEEQYYVLWPVILAFAVWLARRRHTATSRALLVTVVGLGAASLAWSLAWTGANPPYAFFGTMTRAWELAVGGALALTATAVGRVSPALRGAVGWLGLAAVVWAMLTYTEDVAFPGTAALLPVLGTAAVLVAGLPSRSTPSGGPGSLLGTLPLRSIGRVSYSLYLWHWPPLVLVPVVIGSPLSAGAGFVVVLLASIPAVLAYRYVEEPFRRSSRLVDFPRQAGSMAAVLTVIAVASGILVAQTTPSTQVVAPVTAADGTVTTVRLDPEGARDDTPVPYTDGCRATYGDTTPRRCVYGDKDSDRRVALVGDSHALQWFPALAALATKNGWALEEDTKSGCSAADILPFLTDAYRGPYPKCRTWRDALFQRWKDVPASRPDVVLAASWNQVTVQEGGRRLGPLASLEAQRDGLVRTFGLLKSLGITVVLVRDIPTPGFDVPDCLAGSPDRPERCAFDAADVAPQLAADRAAAESAGVAAIDLTQTVCPSGRCAPVSNGVIVFRDTHHVTASFAESMADEFERQLTATPAWDALTG